MDDSFFSPNSELSEKAFKRLSTFINSEFGIKMPPEKRIMLQSRLLKRLRHLRFSNFDEYVEFIFDNPDGQSELYQMIGLVSTHKTNFFRENQHFEFLKNEALPTLVSNKNHLRLWSAGCSTGEEVYTLGMLLTEFQKTSTLANFEILGTDIAKNVLEQASKAIYHKDTIEMLTLERKRQFFLKHKDSSKPFVRVIPNLRSKAKFKWLNLMHDNYQLNQKFDIVFCRNVLIYFERSIQEKVVRKLTQQLVPNGLLFLGHSESIINFKLPLRQIMPTVYSKIG